MSQCSSQSCKGSSVASCLAINGEVDAVAEASVPFNAHDRPVEAILGATAGLLAPLVRRSQCIGLILADLFA